MSTFPRIWGYSGEYNVVGETPRSWIVASPYLGEKYAKACQRLYDNRNAEIDGYTWKWFINRGSVWLVPKKPQKGEVQWFYSEKDRKDYRFVCVHKNRIAHEVHQADLTADQWRAIAEIVGYKAGEE